MDEYQAWMNSGTTTTLYDFIDLRNDKLQTLDDTRPSITDNTNLLTDEENIEYENLREAVWALMKRQSKTKLPDGKHSILVDIGSRLNIIGCNTERAMSLAAARYDHDTRYERRRQVLHVNGVGAGSAPSIEEATVADCG